MRIEDNRGSSTIHIADRSSSVNFPFDWHNDVITFPSTTSLIQMPGAPARLGEYDLSDKTEPGRPGRDNTQKSSPSTHRAAKWSMQIPRSPWCRSIMLSKSIARRMPLDWTLSACGQTSPGKMPRDGQRTYSQDFTWQEDVGAALDSSTTSCACVNMTSLKVSPSIESLWPPSNQQIAPALPPVITAPLRAASMI